jgi:hypothetical protein
VARPVAVIRQVQLGYMRVPRLCLDRHPRPIAASMPCPSWRRIVPFLEEQSCCFFRPTASRSGGASRAFRRSRPQPVYVRRFRAGFSCYLGDCGGSGGAAVRLDWQWRAAAAPPDSYRLGRSSDSVPCRRAASNKAPGRPDPQPCAGSGWLSRRWLPLGSRTAASRTP